MTYDYIIIDTKLMSFYGFHRRQPILSVVELILNSLYKANIKYTKSRFIFAHDITKSDYRVNLWKDYKAHRKEIQSRSSKAEQERRDKFIKEYKKLPTILQYLGTNAITKGIEADDIPNIVRNLYPNKSILLLSLDLDWLIDVNELTHLLYFTTNTLYKSDKDVENKTGVPPHLYRLMVSIGTQAKDNILNIKQFGKGRFIKHLLDSNKELKDDFGEIIDRLLKERKYGMEVHPKAKFKDWRANLHLNLQLMNPIPIHKVNVNELTLFKERLESKLPDITHEQFLRKCYDVYEDVTLIDADEFTNMRN